MGYINFSRSERSQDAIDNYEMPISLITKDIIKEVLEFGSNLDYGTISTEAAEVLSKTSVSLVKKYIKERCIASSWHHTSSRYNETDHYNLFTIFEEISDNLAIFKEFVEVSKENAKKAKNQEVVYEYGYAIVNIWGGTRKHPKVIGTEKHYGIVKGDWLYYNQYLNKCKLSANNTVHYFKTLDYKEIKCKEVKKEHYNNIIKALKK